MRISSRKPLAPIQVNRSLHPETRPNQLRKLMEAIRNQNLEEVEVVYRKSPALMLGRAYVKRISTPILRQQNPQMYSWLEQKIHNKWELFTCAIQVNNRDVVLDLLEKYPKLLNSIHKEIKRGKVSLVGALCRMKVFPEDADGNNFLHVAAIYGSVGVTRFLLEKAPQLNICNSEDMYPIDLAVCANSKKIVELLVRKYLSIEKELIESRECTPLSLAIDLQLPEIVQTLADAGVDLCSITESFQTPFLRALSTRNIKIMDTILQAGGVKALGSDANGSNPTHYAVSMNFMEGLEFLQHYNLIDLSPDHQGVTPLDLALMDDNLPEEVFQFLWKKDHSLTEKDREGTTHLHRIVERGFRRSLEEVINIARNSAKNFLEYTQMREIGLRNGGWIKDHLWVCDENENTLFHIAAQNGWLEILKDLYTYDRNFFDAKNKEGKTGIELMSLSQKMEFSNWLKSVG